MRRRFDSLNPREREVLELVRLGLTNEEIASRLGITLDGAKYHVSQILSKLGVATREEAAAVVLGERRRWWVEWPRWAKIAGGATVAAAVAGIAVLAWGLLRTDGPSATNSAQVAAGPTPIPWIDATPGPTASPTPPLGLGPDELAARDAIRGCTADDVVVEYAGRNGAMMSLFNFYQFGNRSGSSCKIQGPPEVKLLDASGMELPSAVTSGAPACPSLSFCLELGPVVLTPGTAVTSIGDPRPGQAGITLVYRNFDVVTQSECASAKVAMVRFVFAGGVAYDGQVPDEENMAPCRGEVSVWAFGPVATPQPAGPPPPQLLTAIISNGAASTGETLNFVVKVTNKSETNFRFDSPCPSYVILFGERKEARGYHILNCLPAPSLAPSESVDFAMSIDVPQELPPGSHPLSWILELPGTIPNSAEADVTVMVP